MHRWTLQEPDENDKGWGKFWGMTSNFFIKKLCLVRPYGFLSPNEPHIFPDEKTLS